MFFVYVLINQNNNKTYIGQTNDLQKRLDQHNNVSPNFVGSYTNKFDHNWQYLYVEASNSRIEARKRERWFKTGIGRDCIRELVDIVAT